MIKQTVFRIFFFSFFFFGRSSFCFAQDIRDIRPPVSFPPDFFFLLIFLAVLLFLGVFFLIKYAMTRAKKTAENSIIVQPPHLIAYRRLEELRKKDYLSQGRIKQYFIELSDIVRKYIEAALALQAPEMTTEEFLWHLRDSSALNPRHKELLKNFLYCCDMVKFAKYGPTSEEIENTFLSAYRFVDETKPETEIPTKEK